MKEMNFKEALIAHLQGEKVDSVCIRTGVISEFLTLLNTHALPSLLNNADKSYKFRLAQRIIFVNGVEVPAPESVAPVVGATYYIPTPDTEELWSERWNQCSDVTSRHIERGLVYLNKEYAIARAKAMLLTSYKEES